MTTGAGSGKTPAELVLAGIERREALARAATLLDGSWRAEMSDDNWCLIVGADAHVVEEGSCLDPTEAEHIAANDPAHVLAVLAAAREELADAVAQQDRHTPGDLCSCDECVLGYDCPDAQQAARTLARLAALYGGDA